MADSRNVEIESYYNQAHRGSWIHRSAGMMGGAALGVAFGGAIGVVAAFLPYIFGALGVSGAAAVALPGLSLVAGTAAVFAGAGALLGITGVGAVGASAGAVSAGLEEKEKREKANGLSTDVPVTITAQKEPVPKLFNWKAAAMTVPLMAAFGALIAMSPFTASALALLGFEGAKAAAAEAAAQSATTAAIAASASMFGMFGVVFALKMSYLTNMATNFFEKVLKGNLFSKAPEPSRELAGNTARTDDAPMLAQERETRSFASDKLRFSLQGMIEKSEERNADHDTALTR